MDVAFIIDSSSSMSPQNWLQLIGLLSNVMNYINVGPDGTHVAAVSYSTEARVEFKFNSLTGSNLTAANYQEHIGKIELTKGFTFMDKGLMLAREELFNTSAGMRPDVSKVNVIM